VEFPLLFIGMQQSESVLCHLMSRHGNTESDHRLTQTYIRCAVRTLVDLSIVAIKTVGFDYTFYIKEY